MSIRQSLFQLKARERRLLSAGQLKSTLALFIIFLLVGLSGLSFILVSRVFNRMTPSTRDDLIWKVRAGARELAQRADLGIVLYDAKLVQQAFGYYATDADVLAIVATNESDAIITTHGTSPLPLPALFAARPGEAQIFPSFITSWNPSVIEGRTVGRVGVVVSTSRLAEVGRLRQSILAISAGACAVAVMFSLFFTAFYLGPIVKLTQDTLANLQETNSTLESRVAERTAELVGSIDRVEESLVNLRDTQARLVEASRLMGMADVATAVLHNVGNVLNSVNVSATLVSDRLAASRVSRLPKIVELLEQNAADLGHFFTSDPRGKKLPEYLSQLTQTLARENSEAQVELELLKKNIEHIKVIVSMQQSNAKSGGVMERLDVHELVQDALDFNAAAYARHSIELTSELGELPLINLDRHKVFQILMNLLTNARQAVMGNSVDDRHIKVRAALRGEGQVAIEVEDNGSGVAAENLERIFNLGFTTKKDGHGFGLHSSACAAREMHGDLTVGSGGPGRGATFTLTLLLDDKASPSSRAA